MIKTEDVEIRLWKKITRNIDITMLTINFHCFLEQLCAFDCAYIWAFFY